ncbi:HAD-IC family P-type ATPase [Baekduia soli]|uniref:HAD-IC family P-type ATPase n=1 Tax=Baekduia soli TaxID=496014 RepID=A0A5B8U1R8_9ACTN|nr:HAD-IC family P-type ATPase [Baekduia soli]QEC46921.1 HAD-IC family P-type ATPase [Baekduia soli]
MRPRRHSSDPPSPLAPPPDAPPGAPTGRSGLTEAEAHRRLLERGEVAPPATSRSYASIVRANTLTVFNLILIVFGAMTLAFADWRDALFLGVLVANTTIGIVQEVRAKRALDRLAALVAPTATVVRDGRPREAAVAELVPGDLVRLKPGDQVVADGRLTEAEGLGIDASILTGEAEAVAVRTGDEVRSGSFAVEGGGAFVVEAVGPDSYAERVAGEARRFRHPRSPLEQAVNRLLFGLVGLMLVLGGILGYALWRRHAGLSDAVSTSTAAVLSMVPEGLVLLVSLTYAVASLRMARRGALAQQLNAIESLAAVDVICTDKTGTLTEAALRVVEAMPAPAFERDALTVALARYAASTPERNGTLAAIAEAFPAEAEPVGSRVPFSSQRRWSALELSGETLALGAPERFELGSLRAAAEQHAAEGRRVLALARGEGRLDGARGDTPPPVGLRVMGLVVLGERLRPDTREMVAYLLAQNVELKVLSGDAPATVAAIARDAGIPVGGPALVGADLPDDPVQLRAVVLSTTVVGRISPDDKRRFVQALADAGRYVAMVGDGVNDVPALKASRLAIAQGTGAQMARSVADLVLVRGSFAVVPPMIEQGRQALRNLQRVAKLYVTKSAFAAFLILLIGTTSTAYPLLPRHFSLAAGLTIGIPTFFLALAPSSGPWRSASFSRDVARFAVPAGTLVGVGVLASYLFGLHTLAMPVIEARTVAITVLIVLGLYLIVVLEATGAQRLTIVSMAVAALAALYVVALLTPPVRRFFLLAPPNAGIIATAVCGSLLSLFALALSGFTPGAAALLTPPESPAAPQG